MKRLSVVLSLACVAMFSTAARAASYMESLFGCTDTRHCVVTDNFGGNSDMFEKAALEARRYRTKIRIRRHCHSACVLFASRVREQVCLESTAMMGLHYGTRVWLYLPFGQKAPTGHFATPDQLERYLSKLPYFYQLQRVYELPDYGDDINEWALAEDKMPYGNQTYVMKPHEAARWWKACK